MTDQTEIPEDQLFDPTMKKKKKKKPKDTLDLDAEEPKPEDGEKNDADKDDGELSDDLDDFSKKKKKKKKTPFNMEDMSANLPDVEKDAEEPAEEDLDLDDQFKKKKKKRVKIVEPAAEQEKPADEAQIKVGAWVGTDRDYMYEELLTRVFDIIREKNPDIVSGDRKKLVLRPPQVVRIGSKKTSFVNFHDIAKLLRRQPKHLMSFLLAELGTNGTVDGNNQLIIKGRFQPKHIESVLRRYIKEYVSCHTCKSPDTLLQKDTRLFFLQCQTCGSRCSVTNIKSGFQAVTGKRAAIRYKTAA